MIQNFNFNLEDLYLFYQVVDKGGFLRASEATNICQAKISRRIGRLEEAFGAILLYRDMRNIRLTDTGKIVFESAKVMLEETTNTHANIQKCHQEMSGPITFSIPTGFAGFFLLPMLKDFLNQFPEVLLNISGSIIENPNLMLGEADIAIMSSKPDMRESLVCETLCTYPFYLYASEEYLNEKGTPRYARELDNHNLIAINLPYSEAWKNPFLAHLYAGREENNPRRPFLTLSATHDQNFTTAVSNNLGIALLPAFFVEGSPHVKRIQLEDHQDVFSKCLNKKYLVYPKLLKDSNKHKTFIEFLRQKGKEFQEKYS